MRQYELAIRIAQVHHLVDERKYKKALAVIQTLDMRQVRSLSDLRVFAEVYTRTEQFDAAKATYLRIYRRSQTRRVLNRLIYLSIRTNALEDAEIYYQEFVRMNPNKRDALILRYRIDKAKGVPIGQLIDILQALKQEEYIEEWAYELAKLLHRAGRREECLAECEDIILWFGTGEIVERAKILIDHLEERDPIPYYDDKDFTEPKKEEPNPEDTGSLPDLNEFIRERKAQKKEERRLERTMRYEEPEEPEMPEETEKKPAQKRKRKENEVSGEEFVDDYEEDSFDIDGIDLPQKAKEGIHKLSDLFGKGKKEEGKPQEENLQEESVQKEKPVQKAKSVQKEKPVQKAKPEQKPPEQKQAYVPHSQSGTGITQDLAKEISAIYEMEHREQLKEKAVTVIQQEDNLASDVVDRMAKAIKAAEDNEYIPADIEEIHRKEDTKDVGEQIAKAKRETSQNAAVNDKADTKDVSEEAEAIRAELEEEDDTEGMELFAEEMLTEPIIEEPIAEEAQEAIDEPEEMREEADTDDLEEMQEEADTDDLQEMREEADTDDLQEMQEEADTDDLQEMQEEAAANEMHFSTVEPQEDETALLKQLLEGDIYDPEEQKYSTELEGYQAPDIPVVENEYMEMPEITYEDLPTTRALQQSFENVLHLIEGERDPSHFVLMGAGTERIVGVTKRIVRVMKNCGYASRGRIAKINAAQLNKMDLIGFRMQLKGNCLLITEAADLLFPTITKIFSIMEEYYGDFVVILADEGTTLDQLFRFVPVLAKKFKYIIDISNYTKEDYEES
ncbi:MAG: hypothetical protein LUH14_12525 [Clostridiaceae bacterium]|nr:hypothetical protein [Clostridiaceae bacterium]